MVQDPQHEMLCKKEVCENKNLRCIDNANPRRSGERMRQGLADGLREARCSVSCA